MGNSGKGIRLGDVLVNRGIITQQQLSEALGRQKELGLKLGETLVVEGFATEDIICQVLSDQLGYPVVDPTTMNIPDEILHLVPVNILRKGKMIPYAYDEKNINALHVAMVDPLDMLAIDDISIITNLRILPSVATQRNVMLTLDKYYSQNEVNTALEQYTQKAEEKEEDEEELLNADVNSSPIVKMVTNMIEQAVRQRASDIHVEPMDGKLRIRYRIDGALYEKATYSIKLMNAVSARIKIIGGMNIAEKRKPQDGRITQVVDSQEYDIRVSVLPTVYGEKIVMRLTSKMSLTKNKRQLGFDDAELDKFDHILSYPNGILLVTGPTGSGKSTTLYTALSELNKEEVNIVTVEDPVEADIDGINQVQVNPKADLTFATALRSILRQDPDIIMIGEIRDTETAEIAVQASITGHLVVSTLHTNSSASTITRLENMGIPPYLLADSMIGVIAQRLVRRLCNDCKKPVEATPEEKRELGVPEDKPQIIYQKCGCPKCGKTGYLGRIGVYELMEVTHALKIIIGNKGNADNIKEQALKDGMSTLHMSARRYVLEGVTTLEEMRKISFEV